MARNVTLNGGSPWGFRLVGGRDFHATLAISKVSWYLYKQYNESLYFALLLPNETTLN